MWKGEKDQPKAEPRDEAAEAGWDRIGKAVDERREGESAESAAGSEETAAENIKSAVATDADMEEPDTPASAPSAGVQEGTDTTVPVIPASPELPAAPPEARATEARPTVPPIPLPAAEADPIASAEPTAPTTPTPEAPPASPSPEAPAGARPESREGQVISGVVFSLSGGKYICKPDNHSFGPKIMMLDRDAVTPEAQATIAAGRPLDVTFLRETKPSSLKRGSYIVGAPQPAAVEAAPAASSAPETTSKPEKVSLGGAVEVDFERGVVHVLDTTVPINPDADLNHLRANLNSIMAKYTLDKRTAETMQSAAEAHELDQNCLLEGETAVSKTSAIEFLAKVGGYKVERLNLNGQSDTSHLLGTYVPNEEGAQYTSADLMKSRDIFSAESQAIIDYAENEGRGLDKLESEKIATLEGLPVTSWRWKHGPVVQAAIEGRILILDEMNLAEPQILESLNSLLEKPRSIKLAANGGLEIRELSEEEQAAWERGELPNVIPMHPNFRIYGTMNPAEYQGRSVMSPAYKNRWPIYHNVENPTAKDYEQMMVHLVYGVQPEFTSGGKKYGGNENETLFERLKAENSGFVGYIPKIAKMHTRFEEMARKREIGKSRREPYIFTRRDLIALVDYLEKKELHDRGSDGTTTFETDPDQLVGRALKLLYVNKMKDVDDRKKLIDTIRSVGLKDVLKEM